LWHCELQDMSLGAHCDAVSAGGALSVCELRVGHLHNHDHDGIEVGR
jgi:hypothetical protein